MSCLIKSTCISLTLFLIGGVLLECIACAQTAHELQYSIRVPNPERHEAWVEVRVPTQNRPSVEMMLPVWSPGFYRIENYADHVSDVRALSPDGLELAVEQTTSNRWKVTTQGLESFDFKYRLACQGQSVTTNWIGADWGVFNGPASFITVVDQQQLPHRIELNLPAEWPSSICGLESTADQPNVYWAKNYDELIDSPIIAGRLRLNTFVVHGSEHTVANVGAIDDWDVELAAKNIERIVKTNHEFWGFMPFKRYVFLNVFRQGGGGLEHLNSTLLTSQSDSHGRGPSSNGWLGFVAHEYFHSYNVKRLRPVELGPFDYEHPPRTPSLWISEGLTSYYGELFVCRSGLASREQYLESLSGCVSQLQHSNGRHKQSLIDASNTVWDSGMSGVIQNADEQVSYYTKGPVVGFLLDAKIRQSTNGQRSLDDVMKLAYQRYSGKSGFAHAEFLAVAEEVAGESLREWFRVALFSTEELDYQPALDWYGLEFARDDPDRAWDLRVQVTASAEQQGRLQAWLVNSN